MNTFFRQLAQPLPEHLRQQRDEESKRKPERSTADLGYDFGAIFHDIEDREVNGTL